MRHTVKLLALFIAIGLTGCATNGDLDTLRVQVQQANVTADAALKASEEAKAIAQQANATAEDAKVTSAITESKIDRMFKKAMYK